MDNNIYFLQYVETNLLRLNAYARLFGLPVSDINSASVLEIGCGSGVNTIANAGVNIDAHFIGLDIDPKSIDIAQQIKNNTGANNVEFICQNVTDYNPEHKFDYIIIYNTFALLKHSDQEQLCQKLPQLLNDNGVVFVNAEIYTKSYLSDLTAVQVRQRAIRHGNYKYSEQQLSNNLELLNEQAGYYTDRFINNKKQRNDLLNNQKNNADLHNTILKTYHQIATEIKSYNFPIFIWEKYFARELKFLNFNSLLHDLNKNNLSILTFDGLNNVLFNDIKNDQMFEYLQSYQDVNLAAPMSFYLRGISEASIYITHKGQGDGINLDQDVLYSSIYTMPYRVQIPPLPGNDLQSIFNYLNQQTEPIPVIDIIRQTTLHHLMPDNPLTLFLILAGQHDYFNFMEILHDMEILYLQNGYAQEDIEQLYDLILGYQITLISQYKMKISKHGHYDKRSVYEINTNETLQIIPYYLKLIKYLSKTMPHQLYDQLLAGMAGQKYFSFVLNNLNGQYTLAEIQQLFNIEVHAKADYYRDLWQKEQLQFNDDNLEAQIYTVFLMSIQFCLENQLITAPIQK